MADALPALTRAVAAAQPQPQPLKQAEPAEAAESNPDEQLRQDDLWEIITTWLPTDATLVADLGTSMFGLAGKPLPKGTESMGQPVWASIGFALPASLGASLAAPERRSVLVSGDGAAQLTVQEISTMLREKTNPIMVIINNEGYTVERAIHGPEAPYNDITTYHWDLVPAAMGGTEETTLVLKTRTPNELKQALATAEATRDKLVMVEVIMDRDDIPTTLKNFAASVAKKPQPKN